jgi:hypothetical protein
VLAYAGVPFADTRYQQGSAPELSRAAWLDVKEKLQLDFPNLPCQNPKQLWQTDANMQCSMCVLEQGAHLLAWFCICLPALLLTV